MPTGDQIMTRTTDTAKAGVRKDRHQDMRELRDAELNAVSGGDCYMQMPRGTNNRLVGLD
jgi:hypothetical protein